MQSMTQVQSGGSITETRWLKGLTYTALSLFLAWHTLAMFVAPLPDNSAAVKGLRSYLEPYMRVFRLDNRWSFFAPNIGNQSIFRYAVEDADGNEHVFEPLFRRSWTVPRGHAADPPIGPFTYSRRSIWEFAMWRETKYLFDALMDDPEARPIVVRQLCQRHADLKPVAISFLRAEEREFWPDDYRNGSRLLDPEFLEVTTLTNTLC